MRTRLLLVCVAVLLLAVSAARAAEKAAAEDDRAPEEVQKAEQLLKAKGLTKVRLSYLLEDDIKLPESLRAVRAAKRKIEENAARRSSLERSIDSAKVAILECQQAALNLSERLSATKKNDTRKYNDTVKAIREVDARKLEAVRYLELRQRELARFGAPPNDYVSGVQDLSKRMDAGARRYAELAADAEVTAALAAINARGGGKTTLGPSAQFAQELPVVRKLREMVDGAVVKLRMEKGVPQVVVTLNGTVTFPMVLDSGAAMVTLPWEVARQLGIEPDDKDPPLKLMVASGKTMEARLIVLKSIRLGQFVVENVECAVLPRTVGGAPSLLGGTFLRHFVYRMDLGAGDLHLSQMSGRGDASEARTAPGSPPAARAPSPGDGGADVPAATTLPDKQRPAPPGAAPVVKQITVPSTRIENNAVATGLRLQRGQEFVVKPNTDDTWAKGTGTRKGKRSDYRGYLDTSSWLAMRWRVGDVTGKVVHGEVVISPVAGELFLYCSDDKPEKNDGSIRAVVEVRPKPAALNTDVPQVGG
jgi:aspartyl protease family protein